MKPFQGKNFKTASPLGSSQISQPRALLFNTVGVKTYNDDPNEEGQMPSRTIHAIQIKLRALEYLSVIVWPFEPDNDRKCCRLINSKRTWLTAQAGDAVLVKLEGSAEMTRYFIESISLFRVDPVEFNGTIVETAQAWLDGNT